MDPMLEKKLVPLDAGVYQEVRFFSDTNINKHVTDALNAVPSDKHGAVLNVNFEDGNIAAVMAARLNDHWSIGVVGARSKAGNMSVGAQTVFVW